MTVQKHIFVLKPKGWIDVKKLGEKVADLLDMPKDIVLDLPKIVILGNKEMSIENFKGIIEYDSEIIRLNIKGAMLTIKGKNLDIRAITDEDVSVCGEFSAVEFLD